MLTQCFSSFRRLSEIFKKGKRHFRKTLRGRSDDQDSSSSASNSSSSPLLPVIPPAVVERKSLPTLLPYPALLPPGVGGMAGTSGQGEVGNIKERIQEWIQQQASGFLEKWAGATSSNPTHLIVSRLNETSQLLDPKSPSCLDSLTVRPW